MLFQAPSNPDINITRDILSFCLNSQFLSQLVLSTDKVIVVGDFNIHVDVENDSLNINFNSILDYWIFSKCSQTYSLL